nr:phosphate transporter PHO1 [Ipomoea batatas]
MVMAEGAADDVIATLEKKGIKSSVKESTAAKLKKKKLKTTAVRIEIPATTPTQTVAALTSMRWDDLVSDEANNKKDNGSSRDYIRKKKIQCAEKIIRGAFVELYRGLNSLNMVAFVKILKKFDKVSKQQASATYLSQVKRSHFISSDKVVGLMDEVETIFTQHYADNDRKKAMKFLIPQRLHKDSHMVPFFAGLFTGCFMTLFTVYGILAHLSGMFSPGTEATYLETVYPVFSIFGLLSLHLFMYGCNLYLWKKTRINYNFIFEFQPNTALKHSDAFLICTSLMTVVMGAMLLHLLLFSRGFSPNQVNAIPGFIFLVLMVDFFMADQLTSQIPLLRHMETTVCYYVAGSFKSYNSQACKSGKLLGEFAYIISFAPYFWRALQCGRKWFDDNDINQLANLGKYVSAMVAVCARLTYARHPESQIWLAIVLATSVLATIYQLYWDLVKDWGFFSHKSKNPYLRDNLILKNKIVYYVSIALNVVLRLAWVETVMRFNVGMLESRLLDFSLASLEVIRRGHWNFYRLENEHLNNVGKFRAVKEVPLPFYET